MKTPDYAQGRQDTAIVADVDQQQGSTTCCLRTVGAFLVPEYGIETAQSIATISLSAQFCTCNKLQTRQRKFAGIIEGSSVAHSEHSVNDANPYVVIDPTPFGATLNTRYIIQINRK